MSKIVVVGGSGFIGRHACNLLAHQGHDVWATCHQNGGAPAPNLHWLPCDLGAPTASVHWPTTCDAVIFLAQARAWRQFPETAPGVFAVNLQGLLHALEYARRWGARRFVYASSGSVYSQTRQPALENEPIDLQAPRTFYAASKLAGELLVQPYAKLLEVVQLRLFVPYGSGQSPDMLLPSLVRNVREGRPLSLQGEDGLLANPVAVADVAECLARCLAGPQGTWNVGGPETLSLRTIGAIIGKAVGREPVLEVKAGTAAVILGDTSALHKSLGWKPTIGFEAGLKTWLDEEKAGLRAA